MGKLKILKDNVEALVFDFDTSQIFSKTTELASMGAVTRSLYCGTTQCYNCSEEKCNQVQCTQVKCNEVRCSDCQYDVENCDCKD